MIIIDEIYDLMDRLERPIPISIIKNHVPLDAIAMKYFDYYMSALVIDGAIEVRDDGELGERVVVSVTHPRYTTLDARTMHAQ